MSAWIPIAQATPHIQGFAKLWLERMLPGDWCCKAVGDVDGSIVVVYYFQENKKVVWTRLDDPLPQRSDH